MGIVKKDRGKVIIGDSSLKERKLNGAAISGTVVTAGTQVGVAHGLGSTPVIAFIMVGDAYIGSVTDTYVYVNSAKSAHAFTAYAML